MRRALVQRQLGIDDLMAIVREMNDEIREVAVSYLLSQDSDLRASARDAMIAGAPDSTRRPARRNRRIP